LKRWATAVRECADRQVLKIKGVRFSRVVLLLIVTFSTGKISFRLLKKCHFAALDAVLELSLRAAHNVSSPGKRQFFRKRISSVSIE